MINKHDPNAIYGPLNQEKVFDYSPKIDPVNPPHYANHKVSPIDLITAYSLNFACGNVIKYVARAKEKNGREDLKKALWYLLFELGVTPKRIQELTDSMDN